MVNASVIRAAIPQFHFTHNAALCPLVESRIIRCKGLGATEDQIQLSMIIRALNAPLELLVLPYGNFSATTETFSGVLKWWFYCAKFRFEQVRSACCKTAVQIL